MFRKCSRCNVWMLVGEYATCDQCRRRKRQAYEKNHPREVKVNEHGEVVRIRKERRLKTAGERLHDRRTTNELEDLLAWARSNLPNLKSY